MEFRNLQAEWARVLLASLADAGVRDVVVSPGSRSTPFLLAALAEERLTCRRLIDERSAAFYALGRARRLGRPSLLLCTSGSAAANYFPAVVEARASGVPLLVLSSDRPLELSGCGANQAIDQIKLFGDHAVGFFDLGSPDPAAGAMAGLRRAAAQAVFRSLHPRPGPVQLNARARKPLEPAAAATEAERELGLRADALLARPISRPIPPRLLPDREAIRELAELAAACERGLILCGPAAIGHSTLLPLVEELAERTGFPVLAEGASQLRFRPRRRPELFVDAFDLLLGSRGAEAWRPELILQIGRFPTSGACERFLGRAAGTERWVLAAHGWHDPVGTAAAFVLAEPAATLEALLEALGSRARGTGAWARELGRAEARAWRLLERDLEGEAELSEGAVTRDLLAALPEGALLAVGNSLPIRHLDRYCRGGGPALEVWSQRGASGIDGLLSGAAGAAGADAGPAALLVGDVSFLHDLGGLAALAELATPMVVVVLQNDGGRIFEQLPLASHPAADGVFDFWLTPHGLGLAPAAEMYSLSCQRVETREELAAALAAGLERPGATIVEAVVPPGGAAERWRVLGERFDRVPEEA